MDNKIRFRKSTINTLTRNLESSFFVTTLDLDYYRRNDFENFDGMPLTNPDDENEDYDPSDYILQEDLDTDLDVDTSTLNHFSKNNASTSKLHKGIEKFAETST